MSTQRTRRSAKTEELAHQALEQIEKNIQNGNKPEVYLQFSLLEDFPLLMEPGTLCSRAYAMESYPRALQKDPDANFPYGEACNLGEMV